MSGSTSAFRERFQELFDAHFQRIVRYLDRLSGDPDLAADLAQETFVRLYRRRSVPDAPEAWLITVALNLFRNARTTRSRRGRLLGGRAAQSWHGDPPAPPDRGLDAESVRGRVRRALDGLPERERSLLLLRAEGYSYRDLARALDLNAASVGTLLARARQRFEEAYGDASE